MDKQELMENILKCRDSHTPEQYNMNRRALMELSNGSIIKPGQVKKTCKL